MILALVLFVVIAIASLNIASQSVFLFSKSKSVRMDSVVMGMQKTIITSIYNDDAWMNQTAVGSCMKDGSACAGADANPNLFDLKDNSGTVLVRSTSATFGFDTFGNPCNTFNAGAGNNACPIQYQLTWKAVSCAATCIVQVDGTFLFNPQDPSLKALIMNPKKYDFISLRGAESGSLQGACNSMNGIFDQSTNQCQLASGVTTSCPPGQYMASYTNTGQITCKSSFAMTSSCPEGTGAVGFLPNGKLDCRSAIIW